MKEKYRLFDMYLLNGINLGYSNCERGLVCELWPSTQKALHNDWEQELDIEILFLDLPILEVP